MNSSKKSFLFPAFVLFVIFADEIFHGFFVLSGSSVESGNKSYLAIFISFIFYFLFIKDIINKQITKKKTSVLVCLILLLVLLSLTQLFYPSGEVYQHYISHLLVYASLCIPAGYVGMRISNGRYNDEILKLLPFFVIFISIVIGIAQFVVLRNGSFLDRDSVLNYQQASYYFAYSFSFGIFYVYIYKKKKVRNVTTAYKLVKLMTAFTIPLCVVGCISSGGRGGFVFLGIIGFFLLYRIVKQKRKNRSGILFYGALGILLTTYLFSNFDVSESYGFLRITQSTTDGGRFEFQKEALKIFSESPILGSGLGSIWWTVGFYSHNIFTDLLAETGIVGTLFVTIILSKAFFVLYKRSYTSDFDLFVLLIYLGVGCQSLFSGYWINMPKLFFVLGYVFTYSSTVKLHLDNNK